MTKFYFSNFDIRLLSGYIYEGTLIPHYHAIGPENFLFQLSLYSVSRALKRHERAFHNLYETLRPRQRGKIGQSIRNFIYCPLLFGWHLAHGRVCALRAMFSFFRTPILKWNIGSSILRPFQWQRHRYFLLVRKNVQWTKKMELSFSPRKCDKHLGPYT